LFIFLCGYPPFEGDNNTLIFKNILSQKLKFDPKEWSNISDEAKDLIEGMLERDPKIRLTPDSALKHSWFNKDHSDTPIRDYDEIINRIKTFNAPKKLQRETLLFLANSRYTDTSESLTTAFDFSSLKNSFRKLDVDNSGNLDITELKKAFGESGMTNDEMNEMFHKIDFNNDGQLNYTEFLAATINKEKVTSK